MAMPFLRRVLLLVAVVWALLLFFLGSPDVIDRTNPFPSPSNELFHVQVKPPFANNSKDHVLEKDRTIAETIFLDDAAETILSKRPPTPRVAAPPALIKPAKCPIYPNKFTNHIRLPNILYNITMRPQSPLQSEDYKFWNPTIIPLPSWAKNQYIIISMVAPDGEAYRRNVLCEAKICVPRPHKNLVGRVGYCDDNDLAHLGPNGGLRCVTEPVEVDVPPTPAERCEGLEQLLADIPGFHDPRLFYSGRGEPILMVVSQSRYACIGLWAIDLRIVYPSITQIFSSSPKRLEGPLMSYPALTELTRNPALTRRSYEKNWVVFSPSPTISYVQYELTSSKRTFAQLIGGGLTTPNMTDPFEEPCLNEPNLEEMQSGHYFGDTSWHQATPSLKLILCSRSDFQCNKKPEIVFFAAIQRKHFNGYGLPVRYERYFVVWSAESPFNMLAISQFPILFANETARGWKPGEVWDDAQISLEEAERRGEFGKFTYTTIIAYASGRDEGDLRDMGTGYLDDEVVVSVGIDDQDGLFGKVIVSDLLQCLRMCPGRT